MCHGGGPSDDMDYEAEPEAVPDEFDWVMQVGLLFWE